VVDAIFTNIVVKFHSKHSLELRIYFRRVSLSGHHGCACKHEWELHPAILRIPTKEL